MGSFSPHKLYVINKQPSRNKLHVRRNKSVVGFQASTKLVGTHAHRWKWNGRAVGALARMRLTQMPRE